MKKLIALIVALVLCLSCVSAFAEGNDDLKSAKAYLYQMYKNASRTDIKVTSIDYDVLATVLVNGVNFKVEWTTDNENVKVVEKEGAITIDVPASSPVEIIYTLTATLKDDAGNTETVSFQRMIPAVATTGVVYVDTPEVGTAYKFALNQANLDATLYLTGEMSGNYLATSESLSDTAPVYLEQAEGGYYLYCLKDGVKNTGEYTVEIKLYHEVKANLKVKITV